MTNPIARQLEQIRWATLKTDIRLVLWTGYNSLLALLIGLLLLESVFYFSSPVRKYFILFLLAVSIIFVAGVLIASLLIRVDFISRYQKPTLARKFGARAFTKSDTLINALELEEGLANSTSTPLSKVFINQILQKLDKVDYSDFIPIKHLRKAKLQSMGLLIFLLLIFAIWRQPVSAAMYRLVHPVTIFPVPKPFQLLNHSKDINILGGESVEIKIQSIGAIPDSVQLELLPVNHPLADSSNSKPALLHKKMERISAGLFKLNLSEVYQDYIYRAVVPSTHFWQPWDEVSTKTYRISVTDRPVFEDFSIMIIPPRYSRLPVVNQKGNQANVPGLPGSIIRVKLKANRPLASGFVALEDSQIPIRINGRTGAAEFIMDQDQTFTVNIFDQRGITNRDPIPYHLQILPDLNPDMKIISPAPVVELGDDQTIPFHLSISDDFGFSDLQVSYEVQHPSFLTSEPITAIFTIYGLKPAILTQEIHSTWDLTNLQLFPEDEVHYHFELYDNDEVSGPKKAISAQFIARLPSLADLFEKMEQGEEDLYEQIEMEADELQAISDQLEEARLDLLKSDEIDWEQQQALQQTLDQTREKVEQFKEFAQAMEKLQESADKHGLFSEDMLDKFQQLQELVSELISSELLNSMEEMSKALDNLASEDLLAAIEDMSANIDQLEEQLDRFLDIFERIRAEQSLEEVRERLDQLLKQQTALNEELARTDENTDLSDLARLAYEEDRNSREFENIRDAMKSASEAMEKFSPQSSAAMENLEESELTEETSQELQQSASELKQQNSGQAKPHSSQAQSNLQQLQQQLAALQQQFQNQTVSEMTERFQSIMRDLLAVSKSQEKLRNTTAGLSRNSSQLGDAANRQLLLQDQLKQITASLMGLSRETFAVTPEIGKSVGLANAMMQDSRQKLEQRNGSGSRNSQATAMEALNDAALAVYSTMKNMEQSGSAGGFGQFLERMQQMSGQQQGINNQGMQLALGQMAAAAQQGLMQRMLSEQGQVRKSLQQLMNEMKQTGQQGLGDLSGIASEMDEVIKDLKRQRYTRQTQERQERILSRMLDSQRSLTQRDYKQERKSSTASPINYVGPGGLPADLGQRRSLALEALNRALQSGYPRDYQDMIRRYFNAITSEEAEQSRAN